MVVDPWGAILAEAAAEEEILQVELDLSLVSKIRRELPLIKERRSDVYELRY